MKFHSDGIRYKVKHLVQSKNYILLLRYMSLKCNGCWRTSLFMNEDLLMSTSTIRQKQLCNDRFLYRICWQFSVNFQAHANISQHIVCCDSLQYFPKINIRWRHELRRWRCCQLQRVIWLRTLDLATTSQTSGSTTFSRKAANNSHTEAATEMRTDSVRKRSVRERVYGNESCSSRVSVRLCEVFIV